MVARRNIAVATPAPEKRAGRVKLTSIEETAAEPLTASSYFSDVTAKTDLTFVSSGAAIMDAVLGGGYALGRVVNIVGDRSAGKTLLAIEAAANFHQTFDNGASRYAEVEAAFDTKYAGALGMPLDKVDLSPLKTKQIAPTIEDWWADMESFVKKNKGKPMLYIIDSLDALSDEAELGREIGEASYGGSKPKKLGEMFRRGVELLSENNCLLIVISQLRDKLNVTFGEKQTRSGGRALDFYATHIIWLAEIKKLKRTIEGIDRIIGVQVKARIKKNKVGLPFRDCEYPILFGYGVDDLTANVEWLIEAKRAPMLKELGLSEGGYAVRLRNLRDKGGQEVRELRKQLRALVFQEWQVIEHGFLPKASKY